MRKTIFALAAMFALAFGYVCDHASATVFTAPLVSTGTIDTVLLAAGTNWGPDTEWLSFCGYHSCGDGGGGLMHHNDACTPDNIFCFSDSAGHHYKRNEATVGGTFDARKGGVWLDGENFALGTSHDDSAKSNAVLAASSAIGIATVVFPGVLDQATADLEVPDNLTVDFGSGPIGKRSSNDYRASTILGGILLSAGHKIHLNCSSTLQNGTALQATGTYAPAIFKPITVRDKLNVQAAFTGQAILADCNDAAVQNFSLFGFGSMDGTVAAIELNGQGMHLSGIKGDCMECIYQHDSGGGAVFNDVELLSYLTRGNGNLTWKLDDTSDDGAGHYKVLAEAPAVDDANDVIWHNGDHVYVLRGTGAESAQGEHAISNVTTVTGGACLVAQCQQATLDGTHSADSTAVTATWAAAVRADGNFPVTINSITTGGHSIADIAVGQSFDDAGTCLTGGIVKDVWPEKNIVWLDTALLTLTCSGSAAVATAADHAYVHTNALVLKMSSAQRRATAIKFVNVGGTKFSNGQIYTHNVEVECGEQAESLRFSAINTGEDSGSDESGQIGLLIDGKHTGKDCSGLTWTGGVLGQGVTRGIVVQSDFGKPDIFTGLGVHPGSANLNGVALQIDSGNVVFQGVYSLSPGNVFVGDGNTYRIAYLDEGNKGTGYTANDVLTGSGGTCTTEPQIKIDTVNGGGVPQTWEQTVQGVCSVWPTNPIATTGGAGSGAKMDTDGLVGASLLATGSNFADSQFYQQTYPNPNFQGAANVCEDLLDCNADESVGLVQITVAASIGPITCPDAHTKLQLTGNGLVANVVTLGTPVNGCSIIVEPSLGFPMQIDFGGIPLRMFGLNAHDISGFTLNTIKQNATCEFHYTGTRYESAWCSPDILTNSLPTGMPLLANGQVQLTFDGTSFQLKPKNGMGWMESNNYDLRVLPSGISFNASGTTSSATNHIYLSNTQIPEISAIADNGSGHVRYTVDVANGAAGDKQDWVVFGLTCFPKADGFLQVTVVDATHVDALGVSSSGISSCAGTARVFRLYASTTGHAPDNYGVEADTTGGNSNGTWVGDAVVGASHAVGNVFSTYNGAEVGIGTLASDVTIASQTTLQTVADMSFNIGSSTTERWYVEGVAIFNAANATMDVKYGWNTMPASATMLWGAADVGAAGIAGFGGDGTAASPVALNTATGTVSEGAIAGTFGYRFAGIVYGGGTAGTVQFQFAQNTSDAGNLVLKAGSFLRATKIAN